MISYIGERQHLTRSGEEEMCIVWRVEDGKRTRLSPARSQKAYNHSPTGFEWGYGGSGPAQLALALLLDTLDDSARALRIHQDFKFRVVGRMACEQWELSQESILMTVEELERGEIKTASR